MKIYLDYVFLINFLFDFILLLGVSIVLKRNVSKFRIFLGSLFGAFSFFILFFNISSFVFFIFKLIFAIFMIIITFSYKDFRYTINNFVYLIILSILVGGFLYLIDVEIGYSHVGMIFFTNGERVNLFILIIASLITILIYVFYIRKYEINNGSRYKVNLYFNDKEYRLNGFLDTGNELMYFNRPCLILNKNIDIGSGFDFVFIPFTTVSGTGVMKGVIVDKIYIDECGFFENVVVALSNDKFFLGGADIILNMKLLEGKNEKDNRTCS